VREGNNIYLVGMPGAGKTTVGRLLAKRLQRSFVDSDHEIRNRTGVKIPVIFEVEGEEGFRNRESGVITDLSKQANQIVATGGGMVLRQENRAVLKQTGVVIYIRVTPRILFQRTKHDTNRPLLQVADPMNKLEEMFAQRDPLYREVADIVIHSSGGNINDLVARLEQDITRKLKETCRPPTPSVN
jgi:shikimate kinase